MSGWVRRVMAGSERLLRISAVLTILALALMVWSMFDPTVWPVMVAMSAGQGLGTLALGLYLFVVVRDMRAARREKDGT